MTNHEGFDFRMSLREYSNGLSSDQVAKGLKRAIEPTTRLFLDSLQMEVLEVMHGEGNKAEKNTLFRDLLSSVSEEDIEVTSPVYRSLVVVQQSTLPYFEALSARGLSAGDLEFYFAMTDAAFGIGTTTGLVMRSHDAFSDPSRVQAERLSGFGENARRQGVDAALDDLDEMVRFHELGDEVIFEALKKDHTGGAAVALGAFMTEKLVTTSERIIVPEYAVEGARFARAMYDGVYQLALGEH